MRSEAINVLIVGGGITGLTLAIALRRNGINTDLVEIRGDISQQAGVGLSLQGNAIAALARVGLDTACVRHGMPSQHINLRKPDGTLIAQHPVVPMGGPAHPSTVGISRQVLHEILLSEAAASGARLQLGRSIESFACAADGVVVRHQDGTQQRYDLLVAADGVHSGCRATLFPDARPAYCGQAVWRAAIPRPAQAQSNELHVGGEHGVVGICPISSAAAYVYIVESADPRTRYADDQIRAVMLGKLKSYGGELLRDCIAHLEHSTSISYRHLEWLLLADPWYRGRAIVIGDAAHCSPPVLAQGAAMGIEDAVVLAEELASAPSIDQALQRCVQRRLPRAGLVVRNSVQLCQWEVDHSVGPQEVGRLMLETQQFLAHPF
jgi:2-polyprenyl-6-methoxyphenol hydroxylase-like FAD-dependent oxidoreductase